MNWLDIILPYRVWIKHRNFDSIKSFENDLMPKSYDATLIIPFYRKKIKELYSKNEKPDKIDIKQHLEGVNYSYMNNKGPYIAASEASLFLIYNTLDIYQSVDKFVYEGMSKLTGENFDNIVDLSKKVQSYNHNFWDGLSDSGLSKLGGHIGESYAAETLQSKGLDVNWAQKSNQAGWDLLVDGHEINVKTVADANTLSKHFNDYPDIPVIIPGDATNIPEQALYISSESGFEELDKIVKEGAENIVVVDPSLSAQEIMSHTEEATDFLTGAVESTESFIPFITMGLSSTREVRLLMKGHTSVLNSAKNLGLDVAGTGIGGAIGVKAGATIGSLFIPGIGTAVGGLIGGITLALIGRKKTDEIKKKAFNEVFNTYLREVKQYEISKQVIVKNTDKKIKKYKSDIENDLSIEKIKLNKKVKSMSNEMIKINEERYKLTPKKIEKMKKLCVVEIQLLMDSILAKKRKRSKLKAVFYPDSIDFALNNSISSLKTAFHKIKSINSKQISHKDFFNLLAKFGLQEQEILNILLEKEVFRYDKENEYRKNVELLTSELCKKRFDSISKISKFITKEVSKTQSILKEKTIKLSEQLEIVNEEKRKLGLG